jgi:hypothetical protein
MATVIGVLGPVKTSFTPALHIEYRAPQPAAPCTKVQVSAFGQMCPFVGLPLGPFFWRSIETFVLAAICLGR